MVVSFEIDFFPHSFFKQKKTVSKHLEKISKALNRLNNSSTIKLNFNINSENNQIFFCRCIPLHHTGTSKMLLKIKTQAYQRNFDIDREMLRV